MKKIGIVTSGGDAPGMNAAIRALVRLSAWNNIEVIGFIRGWEGIINNRFIPLNPRSVSGILHLGGTILKTSRSQEFKTREGLEKSAANLEKDDVEGLIVIGGEGSVRGAYELSKFTNVKIVVLPASIDNDIYGTDETIGFDTAVNTALNEINKIRDTAISHERTFIVEVMGRKRGFLAVEVGLTAGAEVILVPEASYDEEAVLENLRKNVSRGKTSSIIVIAEGVGKTNSLAEVIEKKIGIEVRVSILGYVQRGGSPTARSRHLASIFSEKAIELLLDNIGGRMVGIRKGEVSSLSLAEPYSNEKPLNLELLRLAEKLAI